MPFKKKVTGSGFTKRRQTVISGPFGDEEIQAIMESTVARENDLDMIERNCKAILQRAGLPDSQRVVVWREDGSWREALDGFDTETAPGDESIGSLSGRIGDGRQIPEDSPEGYASRMLAGLDKLRGALERGETDRAGREGLYLGALWRETEMKIRIEPSALHGNKFEEGSKKPHHDVLKKAMIHLMNDIGWGAPPKRALSELWIRGVERRPPYDIFRNDREEPGVFVWVSSTGKENYPKRSSLERRLRRLKEMHRRGLLKNFVKEDSKK